MANGNADAARARIEVFSLTSAIRKSALHYNFRTRFLLPLRSISGTERAGTHAREALRLLERKALDAEQSADVGEALLISGRVQLAGGDKAAANETLQRAVRCLTNGLGPAHTLTKSAAAIHSQALGAD